MRLRMRKISETLEWMCEIEHAAAFSQEEKKMSLV